jgi:hypothetical protein
MMAELIRNDVLKKKPMNFCLNFLLIRPKSTGWQIHGHGLLVYNTHIKNLAGTSLRRLRTSLFYQSSRLNKPQV